MEQRYQVLRRLQPVLRLLAWVAGGLMVAASVFGLAYNLTQGRAMIGSTTTFHDGTLIASSAVLTFLIGMLVSFVWWLALTAAAELLAAVVDIAENTGATAELLQEPDEESEATGQ